ncbi:tetratricopeptide repeat protein [Streptomyces sp. NEAU-W12]|uniref:tetratricopeptide repeat protein n=1 Tax=Streptomyces sp. NEAU-W12 TaxID=2994668 RepID=UPI00224A4C19|nr:tetratricopeptide repeat protein [Streptomyces sp. NEAU-W12]MCX2923867.1 tetratricopeptide repeat protein [Streptomyces sp. NEAU-W12]
MTSITDLDSLRRAMGENSEQPEGPARNARAEHLLLEAEQLGIPLAVIEALGHQLKVYNYSSEKGKMFVPFARLLRMWDERPEDFDADETHALHWVFKWMSAGMLDQPHIPLASIEKWLGEMERRYRLAGHSERAVRSAEFSVAAHVGDVPRAERAYAAWLAADRDTMADCHACELHGQGWWQAHNGRDAEALELWRPVLEGEFTCAHEPHTVLASSLLPLLRLGRVDEARAHHLRGFRLVRPMESMRGAYADHVEFCALSGNEARALELLAERPAYFTDEGHPRSKLDFLSVVTLVMDRLTGLGLGGSRVPGPAGRTWTAAELAPHARDRALALAARFDERNGTEHVGERARARMARRPLVDRLPLGVRPSGRSPIRSPERPVRPVAPGAGAPAAPDTEPFGDFGLPALLVEARRLSDTLQPHAVEAWAAVARAAQEAEAAGNADILEVRDRAEVADHEAMALGPGATGLFERAAELYAEADDPGEALAARARAAYVHALEGRVDEALAAVAGPHEEVLALYAAGGTGPRQTASVLMARARILTRRVHAAGEDREDAVLEEAVTAVRAVLAFVEGHTGGDVRLAARAAEAQAMLGELAGHSGDVEGAAELSARAAEAFVAAGLPWFAVEYEARLAQLAHHLGDVDGAERALRAALEHGGPYLEPVGRAQLHLQLAEVTGGLGRVAQAADHALEAAHWADEAGEGATLGAWARHQLGGFLLRRGRWAEAAEVLESVLPDVTAGTHGDGAVVQTLWWLGDCLGELGEHRAAAERRLQAAEIARHWPEQQDHATLAHLAAASLEQAGLSGDAERAFARAGELWRTVGDVPGLVRSLRARAWLLLRAQADLDGARALMADAVEECGTAAAAAPDDETRARLTAELGHTHLQFADLLVRVAGGGTAAEDGKSLREEAVAALDRAIATFAPLGPDTLEDRSRAELAAARLEADLGRPAAATARARAVLTAHGNAPGQDGTARALRAQAEHLVRTVTGREAEEERGAAES